jgi:hypothetical protein
MQPRDTSVGMTFSRREDRGPLENRLRAAAKSVASRVPLLREVFSERDTLRDEVRHLRAAAQLGVDGETHEFVPTGHFYSAVQSQAFVRENDARLFAAPSRSLSGLDLREAEQLALLARLEPYYDAQPFQAKKVQGLRYFFENPAYTWADALFLHCLIRHVRPKRIVEVGSGYSSCVTLDTNELFFENRIACSFIEPYPELLRSLLKPGDEAHVEIIPTDAQRVPLETFQRLEANDILFIDSTHVSKIGSDVNYLLFEVLPRLAPGVYVHFHDICYPFEYQREWVYEGRAWSEAYLLRAFLSFNDSFEIVLFNTFLEMFHEDYFRRRMPLCLNNRGGSVWLRRRR